MTIGPKSSGKTSFIKTFTHYKFQFRKVVKKDKFEVSIAKKIINKTEFEIEFIDTKGYDLHKENWAGNIQQILTERFEQTLKNKKQRK